MAINIRELHRRPEAFERNLPHPTGEQIRGAIRGKIHQLLEYPDPSLHHLFTLNGNSDRTNVIDENRKDLGTTDNWEVQREALAAMREFGFDRKKHMRPKLEDHYGKREKVVYRSDNPNLLFVRVRDQSHDRKQTYSVAWFALYSPQN